MIIQQLYTEELQNKTAPILERVSNVCYQQKDTVTNISFNLTLIKASQLKQTRIKCSFLSWQWQKYWISFTLNPGYVAHKPKFIHIILLNFLCYSLLLLVSSLLRVPVFSSSITAFNCWILHSRIRGLQLGRFMSNKHWRLILFNSICFSGDYKKSTMQVEGQIHQYL